MHTDSVISKQDLQYFQHISKQFPSIESAVSEIINLRAILGLPKGTEHFVSDIHGEYESFLHVLKTASGVIKRKLDIAFGPTISDSEKRQLATLISYPEQKLAELQASGKCTSDWYKVILEKLTRILRLVTYKYTRSKVRKALPKNFGYIIEELLHEDVGNEKKTGYVTEIVNTIIGMETGFEFVVAMCTLIQHFAVDRLHILGDIFDRGPGADIILDKLVQHKSIDVQWGNHDVLWMGAAAGSKVCIATALRISIRYGNFDMLREGYGIDLTPLVTFAMETYANDDCDLFSVNNSGDSLTARELALMAKAHKAIAIIECKLVAQAITRRESFGMADRTILETLDLDEGTVVIDGRKMFLLDSNWPTYNPSDPFALTAEELHVINRLGAAFSNSEKLQKHVVFLYSKGSLYLKYNSNLLFHGCIPVTNDGQFMDLALDGVPRKGRALMDWLDSQARAAYFSKDLEEKRLGEDILWFLWAGRHSPLFGKTKMTTFERYFCADKESRFEPKNQYFSLRDREEFCTRILKEFELFSKNSRIINGHVPVKVKKGESPIKAGGKLLVIDGGFARAYQEDTGIAGYTLIASSHGMFLAAHPPFESTKKAIAEEIDVIPERFVVEKSERSIAIHDTDIGKSLLDQIRNLELLILAYQRGLITAG